MTSVNILHRSEDLTVSPWQYTEVAVTAGQTGPTGAADAFQLVVTGTSARRIWQDVPSITLAGSDPWVASIWAVAAAPVSMYLSVERPGPADGVQYTLNITTTWTRFTAVHTSAWTGSGTLRLKFHDVVNTGTKTITVWHPQLHAGTLPATYAATTDHQSIPSLVPGGAALIRGSTSGADANDPAITRAGLVFDGSDDKVTGIPAKAAAWTVISVSTAHSNAVDSAGGKYVDGVVNGAGVEFDLGTAAGYTGTASYYLQYNRVLPAFEILRAHRVLKRNLAVQGVALP